jgi:glycosyltransferase involved in cell wall biosynthesis
MNIKQIVIISGAWPRLTTGYGIANTSTLDYFNTNTDQCIYFGPSESSISELTKNKFPNTDFIPINFDRKSLGIRFIKSLFSTYPAITERFWRKENDIIQELQKRYISSTSKLIFFYEDIPTSYLMLKLKHVYQHSIHIIRSHNIVYEGFKGMLKSSNIIFKQLWKIELNKIKNFERRVYNESDKFYSISDDDYELYKQSLQITPDDVIKLYIEIDRYKVNETFTKNIIFLGSADLRKSIGLKKFIDEAWPIILKYDSRVNLLLGGLNTQYFSNPKQNIHGYGFIENEIEFLNKGSIFINPQNVGSGVNIKSLIAIASGHVLVSTYKGIEGTNLENNIHCIIEDNYAEQAIKIIELLNSSKLAKNYINNGIRLISDNFSREVFTKNMDRIFSE